MLNELFLSRAPLPSGSAERQDGRPFHVYLAGAMEFAPDGGSAWRREMTAFLQTELGLQAFDPCRNELEVLDEEERIHYRRWKIENRPRFLEVIRRIIDHDLRNLREKTGFVICLWDEGCRKGAGTAGELTTAHLHGIPVYVVTAFPPEELSSWLLGCATQVFSDFESLRDHLRIVYSRAASTALSQPVP